MKATDETQWVVALILFAFVVMLGVTLPKRSAVSERADAMRRIDQKIEQVRRSQQPPYEGPLGTTTEASGMIRVGSPAHESMQRCMDELRGQRFYTDICISRQFPDKTLVITRSYEYGTPSVVRILIKNGEILD